MATTRRKFLQNSGIGLLTFYLGGCELELTPEQAKTEKVDFRVLKPKQVAALEALGDVLVPGSSDKGLAHFIDQQLGAASEEPLLMIKYLGANPPFDEFYVSGLAGLDAASMAAHEQVFADLESTQKVALVREMVQENPVGWSGPPAPFFYFVLRNDAVDVVYGTPAGSQSLDIPYMAHIVPPDDWGS